MFSKEQAEGTTKAVLEFSKKEILNLVKKFKNRKLLFIKDEKSIKKVKETKNNSEFKIFKNYVKDSKL